MRHLTVPTIVALAVIATSACGSDGDDQAEPMPADAYFEAVAASATTLRDAVESLFQSPAGLETERIAERLVGDGSEPPDADSITADEEATMRAFFEGFWSEAGNHVEVHRAALEQLGAPLEVKALHDDYVEALDGVIESTDERITETQERPVIDLPDILWEPDLELAAMDAACVALAAAASEAGHDLDLCP